MKKAILGRKVGMTQIFSENGQVIPVTVIQAGPCPVVQKKSKEKDGYEAIQIGFADLKEIRANKPRKGHFNKAEVKLKKYLKEFRLENSGEFEIGQEIKVDIFKEGETVDVKATSKGKGFAGSIKRHGNSRGPMTHGSRYHRGPGSLGSVDAARVFKGRKLPGRMGGEIVTVQNIQVAKIDDSKNLILLKGAVPGPNGSLISVVDSVKGKVKAQA